MVTGQLSRSRSQRRRREMMSPEERKRYDDIHKNSRLRWKKSDRGKEILKKQAERWRDIDRAWIDARINRPQYSSVENYIRWLRGDNLGSDEHE